jgi:hypothetical protein
MFPSVEIISWCFGKWKKFFSCVSLFCNSSHSAFVSWPASTSLLTLCLPWLSSNYCFICLLYSWVIASSFRKYDIIPPGSSTCFNQIIMFWQEEPRYFLNVIFLLFSFSTFWFLEGRKNLYNKIGPPLQLYYK